MFLNPMLHPGPQKQWSQKFLKTAVQRAPPCLDKAVLAQGGGGVASVSPPNIFRPTHPCGPLQHPLQPHVHREQLRSSVQQPHLPRGPLRRSAAPKPAHPHAIHALIAVVRQADAKRFCESLCEHPPRPVQATVNDQNLTEPAPSVAWTRVLLPRRNLRDTRVDTTYYSENREAKHATNALLANRAALTQKMNFELLKTKASGSTHGTP